MIDDTDDCNFEEEIRFLKEEAHRTLKKVNKQEEYMEKKKSRSIWFKRTKSTNQKIFTYIKYHRWIWTFQSQKWTDNRWKH